MGSVCKRSIYLSVTGFLLVLLDISEWSVRFAFLFGLLKIIF